MHDACTRWYRVVHRACDFSNESIVYVCTCVCKNRNPLSSRPIIQINAVKGVTYYFLPFGPLSIHTGSLVSSSFPMYAYRSLSLFAYVECSQPWITVGSGGDDDWVLEFPELVLEEEEDLLL